MCSILELITDDLNCSIVFTEICPHNIKFMLTILCIQRMWVMKKQRTTSIHFNTKVLTINLYCFSPLLAEQWCWFISSSSWYQNQTVTRFTVTWIEFFVNKEKIKFSKELLRSRSTQTGWLKLWKPRTWERTEQKTAMHWHRLDWSLQTSWHLG